MSAEQSSPSAGGSLTRITANLTPRATRSLERITELTGDSKTDVLNRSVMLMEIFLDLLERGQGKVRVRYDDGTEEVLRLVG